MKKTLLFICYFSLIINQSCKQTKKQIFPLENSLLWEISGKGLKYHSYLFGTNHLIGKNFADSLSGIGEKFNTCKAVIGELVFDTTELRKANPAMQSLYNPLSRVFTPYEFAAVNKNLEKFAHLRLIDFDNAKPKVVELLILKSLAPKTTSTANPPLDVYFQQQGKKHGYKIMGFETPEFQSKLLFDTPIDIQKRNLLYVIKNIDLERKNLIALIKLYKNQDVKGTDKLILSSEDFNTEESDKMLKDRNAKWIKDIPKMINRQPTFIAVGFAHLIGEYGLVNQLRLKGYTVKPVKI